MHTIVHPSQAARRKSAIFPFQSLHFRLTFPFLKKYTISSIHTKYVIWYLFYLIIRMHNSQQFQFVPMMYFAFLFILRKFIRSLCSKARDEFPKTHTKTHNDTIRCYKKVWFSYSISSPGQLRVDLCMHIVKCVQSGGHERSDIIKVSKNSEADEKKNCRKRARGLKVSKQK